MYRITVTYGQPADSEAFDRHYEQVHAPLAAQLPGLRSFTTLKGEALDDAASPWYFQANLYFADKDSALAALGSETGQAAGADIANFATGGATLAGGHETEVAVAEAVEQVAP